MNTAEILNEAFKSMINANTGILVQTLPGKGVYTQLTEIAKETNVKVFDIRGSFMKQGDTIIFTGFPVLVGDNFRYCKSDFVKNIDNALFKNEKIVLIVDEFNCLPTDVAKSIISLYKKYENKFSLIAIANEENSVTELFSDLL